MRGLALEHAVADLAFRILDQKAPLRALHEHDEGDDGDRHHQHDQDQAGRERALPAELERAGDGRRKLCNDARHDDQRGAVADTALGDLLAEPHQEHCPAGERDDGGEPEEDAWVGDDVRCAFKPDGDAVGLECGQYHGQIARVLVDGLAPLLALLLESFERRRHRRHQLNDDRGRDIRHDVQRKDRHAVNAAAGEHVEHPQNTAGLGIEDLIPGVRIDAGQRDVGAEPIDEQRAERKPDALLEFFGFGKRAEIEIGCELFRCRDHILLRAPSLRAATALFSAVHAP